ncbi:MFS transporter [Nonomuraea maheshkhaliensis]|uniref:MFS transporter n=1 Tax=Nonomuraea maheshkhaliensis TaxID=419590 RepID=UPI0031F88843
MSGELGYSRARAQLTNVVSMLAYSVACVFAAVAGDRFGRRPMLIAACSGFVLPLPAFWLMGSWLGGALVGTSVPAMLVSVIGTSNVPALVEMFPAKVRASGSAIGYTAACGLDRGPGLVLSRSIGVGRGALACSRSAAPSLPCSSPPPS